ncbi:MAG TPA: 23S rRNA (pseudouridine(1915)-N(3))-methyltransferase RlmH [Candidatus Rubrimentiphilum sp.]|nr:23S rRNA (pseudouridine(1915)-N(3))-methyltransferase RlmH [Candidatus Rubrimentiphilum sp.]
MHLRVVAVGKLRDPAVAAICREFQKRLAAYHRLEIVEVRSSSGSDPEKAIGEEGERILRALGKGSLWLLDRTGTELTSEALSKRIVGLERDSNHLTLVVAGTFGASKAVRDRAGFVWSLSKLTFLHEWARMLVLEQLYRAAKIARSEPYHH